MLIQCLFSPPCSSRSNLFATTNCWICCISKSKAPSSRISGNMISLLGNSQREMTAITDDRHQKGDKKYISIMHNFNILFPQYFSQWVVFVIDPQKFYRDGCSRWLQWEPVEEKFIVNFRRIVSQTLKELIGKSNRSVPMEGKRCNLHQKIILLAICTIKHEFLLKFSSIKECENWQYATVWYLSVLLLLL